MILLPRRGLLAVLAVVDVALHARPSPVAARMLAARHKLHPRQLETVLQALVRHGILKGIRGPRGGYELARERRRISVGEIARAALATDSADEKAAGPISPLVTAVIAPALSEAGEAFLARLDDVSVERLCLEAEARSARDEPPAGDFAI